MIGSLTAEAAEALRVLEAAGELTPERVVEVAADPANPLHAHFQWDDAIAASAYRVDQARALIRKVRVELVIEERTYRAPRYVHDPSRGSAQGYVDVVHTPGRPDRSIEIFVQETGRAVSALNRAAQVAAALGMSAEVKAILKLTNALLGRLDAARRKAA